MTTICHISDTHYGTPGALSRCAPTINAIANRSDASDVVLVHTGDVIDSPAPAGAQYDQAANALRQVCDRVRDFVVVEGNHDTAIKGLTRWAEGRALYRRFVRRMTGSAPTAPYVETYDDVAIITLDSCRTPDDAFDRAVDDFLACGFLGQAQIDAAAGLAPEQRAKGRAVVVALHHSPMGGGPTLRLSDRDALGDALREVGGVDVMLCGHLHERGEWRDKFGASVVLSAPKCGEPGGYWAIVCEGGEVRWGWVDIAERSD